MLKVHVTRKAVVAVVMVGLVFFAFAQAKKPAAFYCKYCGHKATTVASLTSAMCIRHPNGPHKGRHALYEGSAKEKYTCKHCGMQFTSIASLTAAKCIRHPSGSHKGNHEPAL